MKKSVLLLILLVFVSSVVLAQRNAESIVQIEVKGKKRGIGVVAIKKDHVLTALHVVAGQKNIGVYSKAKGRLVGATIVKVHKESDLALLRLDEPLGLPAVPLSGETPDAGRKYFISGYTNRPDILEGPMGLFTNFHPLTTIIESGSPQYKWLYDNGYPLPTAQIIRLGDPIQHGDSGSPIYNANGELVGIADGGLKKGVQRMNWAISTRAHLQQLIDSKEDVNVPVSTLGFLKNARSDNQSFDTASSDLDMYYIFSELLSDIYVSAFPEDQDAIKTYRNYAADLSGYDIYGHQVDVYEDYATGATVAIPNGLRFEYDAANGLLRAWSPSGNVEMNILIKKAVSFDAAVSRVDDFQKELFMYETWYDREDGNLVTDRSYEELYIESINCAKLDESDKETGSLIAEILIDGPYVLATSVTVHDLKAADSNTQDWYFTYLMEACLVLCGFPIY